jgi:hypothetical protein
VRAFLLAFAGYFLLAAAWAVALPPNGTYDEKQHIVRAYSVWTGQFVPSARVPDGNGGTTDGVDAPRSLLPGRADCTWRPKPPKPASCQVVVADRTHALIPTTAGRYSPVYYLAVGLPLRISPDRTGLIWARLLSAALSAVFLALAVALAVRFGSALLVAGVTLVSTPLAMNLNGSINPYGVEISSGVLLFVALLAALNIGVFARSAISERKDTYWLIAGISFAVLAAALHLGTVLGGLALVACLVLAGWRRTLATLRSRVAWLCFAVPAAVGALFAVGWLLGTSVGDTAGAPAPAHPLTTGRILRGLVTDRAEFYLRQIVGQFGYGETTVSPVMIALWYLMCAVVVVPVLWAATWRVRAALIGMGVACFAILAALELHFAPLVGWYAHGRYIMPLGVGIVLAAAAIGRLPDRAALALVVLTVPLDLYALARVMTRFQVGIDAGLHPFGGSWHPPVGSVVPLLACLVGGLLLTVIVKSASVRGAPQHSTVNTLSN